MSALLSDSRIETLLKVNDITALRHFVMHKDDLNFCWASYKIVLRNGYHITKEVFLLTSCNEVNMKTELYGLKGCVSMGINTVSAWYMMRFKVFI